MPCPIGFSTGSLLPGNTRQALRIVTDLGANAIELSALRAREIDELLQTVAENRFESFTYVSVHAPSRYAGLTEAEVVQQLQLVLDRGWSLTLHPDAIRDWDLWAELGPLVCIENMDNRKASGRTVAELETVFRRLPEATFCLDVAHARNIDPAMALTRDLLAAFGARLRQVHLSEVDSDCRHLPLSTIALNDFRSIAPLLPPTAAILLETPVNAEAAAQQLALARELFGAATPTGRGPWA
jgi:hypothetical protein